MPQHYHMIDYIHENPAALKRTLDENETAVAEIVQRVRKDDLRRVIFSGVGSSYTAAVMAQPLLNAHSSIPAFVLSSTELVNYPGLIDKHTLVIMVSRSGERGEVVDAFNAAVKRGAFGVAMTGVAGSLLAQNSNYNLLTREGPESTFPKTKSVVSCAGMMMRLALALAKPDDRTAAVRLDLLQQMPSIIEKTLSFVEPQVAAIVPKVQHLTTILTGGTGSNFGAAMEASVKIAEAAYIPVLFNDTGNLLFSAWGPINATWLLLLLVNQNDVAVSQKAMQLAETFKSVCLAICEPGVEPGPAASHVIRMPEPVDPLLSALAFLQPVQLLTYYWTLANGRNPDSPDSMDAVLKVFLPKGRQEPELR